MEALKRAKGNQGVAATLLGLSRPALNRRLARHAFAGSACRGGHDEHPASHGVLRFDDLNEIACIQVNYCQN
ncbi:MAG: helix-turn-helix domain-containing protein [Candidatus Accumulibacter propinquus]